MAGHGYATERGKRKVEKQQQTMTSRGASASRVRYACQTQTGLLGDRRPILFVEVRTPHAHDLHDVNNGG